MPQEYEGRILLTTKTKNKTKRKNHSNSNSYIKLVKVSTSVDVVAKTDDKVYVLGIIKSYIVTFHLFPLLCRRRSTCWKYQKLYSYLENPYHLAKIIDQKRINLWVSLYCTSLLQKRNYQIFWSSFVVCRLREYIDLKLLPILRQIFPALSIIQIKTLKQSVKIVQTFFITYLSAIRPTLGHWKEGLTHPMFIKILFQLRTESHREPHKGLGTQSLTKYIIRIRAGNLPNSEYKSAIALCHSLQKCDRNHHLASVFWGNYRSFSLTTFTPCFRATIRTCKLVNY